MEQQADLNTYLKVLKRRKKQFILPALAVLLLGLIINFVLPSTYRSEATILVEAQEIPEEMVQSTVTGYVEERIQAITQIVLSRTNLLRIIERFDLYAKDRRSSTTEEIVSKMREDITMEPVQAEVANPQSGRTGMATIAFTLSYEGKEPRKVAQVANTLVSLLLEESARKREEKAQTTVTFLEDQLKELDREITSIEDDIAKFKDKHQLSMPELMELNLQMIHRLEDRIDQKQEEIKKLEDRRIYLEGQLATIEPVKHSLTMSGERTLTPEEELRQLRSQYLSLKSSKSEKHPDVIQMRKQLNALEKEVSTQNQLRDLHKDLDARESELAKLSKRYSDKHPDVIKTRKRVAELEETIEQLAARQEVLKEDMVEPDNPSYINLKTQIKSTEMEMRAARQELANMRAKHEQLLSRIEETPKVEQAYTELLRNYENAKAKYQETKSRLLSARESREMERSRMAQKLTLIDPPAEPEEPYKPNRVALLLIGAVMSMGFGVGSGSLAEFLDTSVHSAQGLAAVTSRPLLAAIPAIETKGDRRRRRLKRLAVLLGLVLAVALGLWLVHTLFRPLDVLWIQIVRKVQFML